MSYQVVSGSYGAAHHDADAARADGFPTWFSVGMFHAGLLATYAVNWLGPENIRRLKYRFNDMMWPGDELTYAGSVSKTYEDNDQRLVDIELACTRPADQIVTQGWATLVVP